MSDLKNELDVLVRDRERYKGFIEATNIATWEWNVQTGETVFNERWAEIIGYTHAELEPVTIHTWANYSHQDDLEGSNQALKKHFSGEADYYEYECRMRHKNGHWVWVLDRGKVMSWTSDGKPLIMMGTHQDISKQKENARLVHESELKFRTLFETLPVGITIADENGSILQSNKAAEKILRITPEQHSQRLINGSEWKIIRADGSILPAEEYASVRALKEKRVITGMEMGVFTGPDEIAWVMVNAAPADGLGVVISYIDITKIKALQSQLQESIIAAQWAKLAAEQARAVAEEARAVAEEARLAAEEANNAKSQFLANMSHEIRTPLNGVIGFTDLLRKTELSDEQMQYVNSANISGRTLLGIINDILDFSKVEAGMLELERLNTDIRQLLDESINLVTLSASNKGIRVFLNVDLKMPRYALVDPLRLKQILSNLLSNAVKFTKQGEVELRLEYQDSKPGRGRLQFTIRDTGIGISLEQQQRLFRSFTQADNSTTRRYGGTGLGLVISQKFAELMGTRISVISSEGVGSQFSFELETNVEAGLPAENSGEDRLVESITTPGIYKEMNQNPAGSCDDARQTSVQFGEDNSSDFLPKHKLPKKILIAEDVPLNMLLIKAILRGFLPEITILEAKNGQEAVSMFGQNNPDIVLMDVQMPEMDGILASKTIREQYPNATVPIVALTAGALREEEIRCMESGMNAFLTKPVDAERLREILAEFGIGMRV
jgi:PAS domain S-box-containing protein